MHWTTGIHFVEQIWVQLITRWPEYFEIFANLLFKLNAFDTTDSTLLNTDRQLSLVNIIPVFRECLFSRRQVTHTDSIQSYRDQWKYLLLYWMLKFLECHLRLKVQKLILIMCSLFMTKVYFRNILPQQKWHRKYHLYCISVLADVVFKYQNGKCFA